MAYLAGTHTQNYLMAHMLGEEFPKTPLPYADDSLALTKEASANKLISV